MAVSPRTKTISIVVAAVVLVMVMVFAVGYFIDQREPKDYTPGEVTPPPSSTTVPEPSPSQWPSSWPATPSPTPSPDVEVGEGTFIDPGAVTRSDMNAVAESFIELTVSWDTLHDEGTQSGLDRAMPLVDDAAVFKSGGNGIGAGWLNASGHQAYSVPSVQFTPEAFHIEEGADLTFPPTGEPITPIVAEASYRWQGRDGWVSETSASRTVFLSMIERDGQWFVIDYGYQDPPEAELAK